MHLAFRFTMACLIQPMVHTNRTKRLAANGLIPYAQTEFCSIAEKKEAFKSALLFLSRAVRQLFAARSGG